MPDNNSESTWTSQSFNCEKSSKVVSKNEPAFLKPTFWYVEVLIFWKFFLVLFKLEISRVICIFVLIICIGITPSMAPELLVSTNSKNIFGRSYESKYLVTWDDFICLIKSRNFISVSNRSWSISILWCGFIEKINNWKVCDRNDAADVFKLRGKANAKLIVIIM